MRTVSGNSSTFTSRLNADNIELCELIELTAGSSVFRWTSSNKTIQSSGYEWHPFPGQSGKGTEESIDLGVSAVEFIVANTGSLLSDLIGGGQLDMASVVIRRVLIDTPDLGAYEVYRGQIADFRHTRDTITGQARSGLQGVHQTWPYYNYQDNCAWKFGGSGCGFNTNSITFTGSISANSSDLQTLYAANNLLANSYSVGVLQFGKVTITSGLNSGQVRSVFNNTGDLIVLSHPLPFNDVGSGFTFSIRRGCRKRLVEDCTSLYNNNSAFLGFPWIPRQEDVF